jgi:hypothetical protein
MNTKRPLTLTIATILLILAAVTSQVTPFITPLLFGGGGRNRTFQTGNTPGANNPVGTLPGSTAPGGTAPGGNAQGDTGQPRTFRGGGGGFPGGGGFAGGLGGRNSPLGSLFNVLGPSTTRLVLPLIRTVTRGIGIIAAISALLGAVGLFLRKKWGKGWTVFAVIMSVLTIAISLLTGFRLSLAEVLTLSPTIVMIIALVLVLLPASQEATA